MVVDGPNGIGVPLWDIDGFFTSLLAPKTKITMDQIGSRKNAIKFGNKIIRVSTCVAELVLGSVMLVIKKFVYCEQFALALSLSPSLSLSHSLSLFRSNSLHRSFDDQVHH